MLWEGCADLAIGDVSQTGADGAVVGGEDRAAAAAVGDLLAQHFAFRR